MSTQYENAPNDKYMFRYKGENSDDIISYKKNLVECIKDDNEKEGRNKIQHFPTGSITEDKFNRFIESANNAGYTIYKVEKL